MFTLDAVRSGNAPCIWRRNWVRLSQNSKSQESLICTNERFLSCQNCIIPMEYINDHYLHLRALAECISLWSCKLETSYNTCFTQEELNHTKTVALLRSHRVAKKAELTQEFLGCPTFLPQDISPLVIASSISWFAMCFYLWIATDKQHSKISVFTNVTCYVNHFMWQTSAINLYTYLSVFFHLNTPPFFLILILVGQKSI